MTVEEMLDRISSHELSEWAAFEQVFGPIGGERDDLLAGVIAAASYNARRQKKGDPITHPRDLMPVWDTKPRQTWQDQLSVVKQIHAAFGGTTKGAS